MASARSANLNKAIVLVILMITMTQVGYLDSMNSLTSGEETLEERINVLETSASTSIVLGNNSQWAPSGSLETFGFRSNADIIATSDDVILLKGQNGKDSRVYCIIAYNFVNKTSWQPTIVGTSQCPSDNSGWKFIGIIDGVTLVRYDSGSSTSGSQAIFGYNPSNDTFYSIASLPSTWASVGSAAMIGRNVYMGTSHSDVTIFNYDNQTIWDLTNLNCGYSFHSSFFGAVGDKIFSKCGNHLGIFDPVTQSLSIPSDLSSVYVNSTLNTARSVVLGDQLLFLGDDGVNGKELWVYDASNDSAWMAADIAVGSDSAWSLYGNLNPMRSGTKVLFGATDQFSDKDLWWYESLNGSVWRATNFSDPNIEFQGHSTNFYGELANGVIAIGHRNADNPPSTYYSNYISFYNPTNGTVWQESGLYQSMESNSYALNNNGEIKLRAVYGNTIIGTAHANTGSPVGHYVKVFAYDITNQTLQFSSNLGEAQYSHNDIVNTNMVTFGDHILYGLACGVNIANSCPSIGGGRQAAIAWSPGAIAVNDAWNISQGDRLDGPISGGDGRFYNSGVGVQNLTASAEGAELTVGLAMTNITFGTNSASSDSLALGYNHACGLLDNGSVKCWGVSSNGRLGNFATQNTGDNAGEMGDALAVSNLGTGRTATSISSGLPETSPHTCAVLDDGTVKCWGGNAFGQLGIGNTTTMGGTAQKMGDNLSAVDLGTGRTAVDVSVGDRYSCALLDNGDVKCWGRNTHGQLGIGNTMNMGDDADEMGDNLSAVDLGTGRTAVGIATGYAHACAILDNGLVKCWGINGHGRLGIGSTTNMGSAAGEMGDNLSYTSLGTGLTPVHIDAGNGHTCALFDNGSVKCWGFNQYGNLGLGSTSHQGDDSSEMGDNLSFVDLGTGRTAVDLSATTQSVCAVLDNGDVQCWGRNQHGQLGIESTLQIGDEPNEMGDNLTTADLGTGVKALAIKAGFSHVCAILDNGSLKCWGSNGNGWLGLGDATTRGDHANEMGDNLPFVDLGTGVSMAMSVFTSCTSSPNLPLGLSMNNCTISGTPTSPSTNQTYTINAVQDGVTYRTSIYLSASYLELTPSAEGADLIIDGAMTNITFQYNASAASGSGGMTNVTGATSCTASPNLPTGLSIDSSTCTISGTPTVETVNATYTVTAVINSVTYQGSVWLSATPYGTITSAVEGAALNLGEAMAPISLNYTSQAPAGSFYSGNGSYWMTKDINPTSGSVSVSQKSGIGGWSYGLASLGDFAYFAGMPTTTTSGLWKSDGTESGTVLVKEHLHPKWMVSDGNSLYFHNGSRELWMSDGTTSGTVLLTDFNQTLTSGGSVLTNNLGVFANGLLFFVVDDTNGRELWSSDGTTSGTQMVKDIRPGYPSTQTYNPYDGLSSDYLYVLGNHVYFAANDGTNGTELWKSDGTASGTMMVKDIYIGGGGLKNFNTMTVLDNNIYFTANDGTHGTELWKSDGTTSGTMMVKDINTNILSSGSNANSFTSNHVMTTTENMVIFSANDGTHGNELWKTDGTAAGTALVMDLTPGSHSSMGYPWSSAISHMTSMGDLAFFYVDSNSAGASSYKAAFVTDGTPEGTFAIANSSSLGYVSSMTGFTAIGDQMYFVVGAGGSNLYVSDGTINGTTAITPFTAGASTYNTNSFRQNPVIAGNTVFFGSCTGVHHQSGTIGNYCHEGIELMAYDPVNITLNAPPPVSWETEPPLPAGMSISGGTISGTPSVYASNQTYTIYANQSGYSTTHELYFSVDTTNAHTVVENQTIDPIGFHPPFWNGTTTWTVSPALPGNLTNSSTTGEITGMVNTTMSNSTYTVTATHSDGSVETFTFNLQSLADYDGDGLANDLPGDYDAAEGPTPGLVADDDDDADGLLDTVETNTGTYVDSSNTGTDPLNPDTDGDGICDGPNAVPGVCVAGPDFINGASIVETPVVLVNNSDAGEITPFYPLTGATYGLSPDLPTSMQFDSSNGSIWGTPDMLMTNTTYTMWANLTDGTTTSWTFFLEVLEDLDGDGMPDVLPGDYNATNDPIRTPGLEEDLDDDGDGYNDTAETDTGLYLDGNNTGTDPRDPDTDDDGICDGPGTVAGVCTAGPDLTPFGPPATVVAVNNTMIPSVPPYYAGSGLTYGYSPDLPNGLTIDPNNGYLMGIPTETTGNITYTVYANDTNGNTYSWDFTIEVLEDSDGDGSPDSLPSDYDGDNDSIRAPPGLTEDLDDDGDGASDLDEIANGTEPLNPDTDGDGLCDGINAVPGVCFAGPDPYPNDPTMPIDTDGDGLPDDDSGWTGPPYADDDDDNDGYPDVSEDACGSDSLDADSIPADMDGDTICDGDDDDMDGDGIENVNETGDTTVPPGSSPINPDTDGDGICDGPESPVTSNCTSGPDMFPLDPSAWEDTDGDGYPNDLYPPSTSVPPLEEDTDDDNDGWSDIDEVNCGSDPVNGTDMPVDENGDGICDVLDLDWDDDGIPNANETDTGVYVNSSDTGTDPWNPDTDGDGFCDGPFAVMNGSEMICSAGPDPFPHDPTLPMDTDGDGLPDDLPEDYIGNLVADDDDDNDGYTDAAEDTCGSDSLDNLSMPTDLDGDTICDGDDLDMDGDGILNDAEDAADSITSSSNADTDGDGVCDGPSAPAMPAGICTAGPDAFPDDAAAWLDTDGDGNPDEIVDGITTDLILDTDDDDDGWSDVDEAACGTDSKDDMSTPFDGDDDDICDVLDTQTLGYAIYGNESDVFEAYVNQSDFVLIPNLTGMEPGIWTIDPALPAGLSFSGTARSGETGIISGIPTEASPMQNYTITADNGRVNISFTLGLGVLNDFDGDRIPDEESVTGLETDPDDDNDGHLDEIELKCGSDPLNQTSVPDVDEEGNCIEGRYAEDDSDDGTGVLLWCLPLVILLLVLLLLIPLLIRDKVALMGPEPENTTSTPAFMSGNGTKSDPFVLRPIKKLKAGSSAESKEAISITNMSPEILVDLLDLAESNNDKRFMMYEIDGASEESGYKLEADEEGRLRLRFVFDDSANPTYPGAEYEGLLKLGKASVYLSWTVEVKEDKRKMNQIRKEQEAAEKAEKEAKEAEEKAKAEAEAKEAEEKAKVEAEAKAAKEKAAKEAEKKAKAEEKAAAAALAKKEKEEAAAKKKEEAAAKKAKAAEEKAAKEAEEVETKAKAAEEKAAKEAEKKAKAEEKAAAATAAKKAKEEEEAKKKAEAEAKAAAKKKVEKKPAATKEAKKEEELQRVKKRAKSIDFKVIGEASSSELKSEVKKGATTLEVANAKDFAESGSAEINDAKGSNVIAWTGKDGNTLTGVSGVIRVFAAKAVLMVKDDLQVIKGIGPFIEEKLNALGITTYRQLANMTAKLETQVNEAIEFFPGRVKRDQWVAQAKILLGMDAKLDEKALKKAEELERVAQKAEGIDFAVLGVASASEADDLQKIKGIGPFIAEKLNALGIYRFSQLANMTSEIEEEVNVAIEFFPGRVKRDEWAKQAKELAKD